MFYFFFWITLLPDTIIEKLFFFFKSSSSLSFSDLLHLRCFVLLNKMATVAANKVKVAQRSMRILDGMKWHRMEHVMRAEWIHQLN